MWKVLLICVICSIAYGDVADLDVAAGATIKIYSTSKANQGYNLKQASFGAAKDGSAVTASLNAAVKHQKIVGFGGAFTDATGINLNKLPADVKAKVLQDLFGPDGIGMNLCRVPIGATEFSPRDYSLDDHDGDTGLKQFALQNEDLVDKIPIIKEAQSLRKGSLKLFGSAWTAPAWMKDHKTWVGFSMLSDKYGQLYAEYLKKFLDAYAEKGVDMWGITTGTNPLNGFQNNKADSMGWLPEYQNKWIKEHFGPVIRNSSHKGVVILGHDDTADTFGYFAPVYVHDKDTMKYLDGLATHWYIGYNHASVAEFAKNDIKEMLLIASETTYGRVQVGDSNWEKGFNVMRNIFTRLEWNYAGWVDYNLVLNAQGGPSHANQQSDAPIIINQDGKSYRKTATYYAIGHFSKYVIPGSVRIDVNLIPGRWDVHALAFLRPDNIKVVSILNANTVNIKVQLNEGSQYSQVIDIPGLSFHTMLYS